MSSPTQWTWFGWTLGVGDGQGGLAGCGSWGCKESDMTEWLNWTELNSLNLKEILLIRLTVTKFYNFPGSLAGKESTCNAWDPGLNPGLERSPEEGISYPLQYSWFSLVTKLVKNLPAMWETWVWSLGWEDPLEKGISAEERNRYPLQYSGLNSSMECIVYGVTKSCTWLSKFHFTTKLTLGLMV